MKKDRLSVIQVNEPGGVWQARKTKKSLPDYEVHSLKCSTFQSQESTLKIMLLIYPTKRRSNAAGLMQPFMQPFSSTALIQPFS